MGRVRTPIPVIDQAALPGLPGPALAVDRQLARLLSAQLSSEVRLGFARAFAAAVVANLMAQKGLQPRPLPDGLVQLALDGAATATAERLSVGIGAAPVSELTGLLGAVYTAALPDEYRSQHGIYYTPPALVTHLLDMATAAGDAVGYRTGAGPVLRGRGLFSLPRRLG